MVTNTPPDITARPLAEAEQILLENGWEIARVSLTRSPGKHKLKPPGKIMRVVRQRVIGKGRVALATVYGCRGEE